MPRDEFGLTHRQRLWADAYIETGNGLEADRRAGYKQRMSDQNIHVPAVKAYIAQRMKPAEDKRIADADEVLQYLSDVMRGAIKDQFGLDASLQDRTKAAQELMKRYAVADMRQASTMQRLDSLFVEFRAALASDATAPRESATAPESAPTAPEAPAPTEATPPEAAPSMEADADATAPEASAPSA